MIEAEDRRCIKLEFNRFYYLELRKILWQNSISPQEFFSHVTKLLATGDQRVHDMLKEAKASRANKELTEDLVHTDEESLYSLIEQSLGRKEG